MKLIPAQTRSLPKIYGHFAAATIVLTTLLAIIADGANNGTMTETMENRRTLTDLEQMEESKYGKKELWRVKPRTSFTHESASSFGEPMDRVGAEAHGGVIYPENAASYGTPYAPAAYAVLGITEAEWNALSEEERQRLLQQMQAGQKAAEGSRNNGSLDKLAADSRRRAGSGNFD